MSNSECIVSVVILSIYPQLENTNNNYESSNKIFLVNVLIHVVLS